EFSAKDAPEPAKIIAAQMRLVKQIQRLCNSPACRHKMLSEHFGQAYDNPNCGACDVCLGEVEGLEDATVTAQKILSCIARTGERFGVGHIVDVLEGADTERIRSFGHDKQSTYGLLKEMPKKQLQSMVYQLVDHGLVARSEGDRPVLSLNDESWAVMRGQREVRLVRAKKEVAAKTRSAEESWEGVDRGLFDHLREWRKRIAADRKIPPFTVMHDSTLMELARIRPTATEHLRRVTGIGEKRLADLGAELAAVIDAYCEQHHLTKNQGSSVRTINRPKQQPSETKQAAFLMFEQGRTIAEVMACAGRAQSTVVEYLSEFIETRRPAKIDAWVAPAVYERVIAAAADAETPRLKPLFERLGGEIPYDEIRLVLMHLRARADA
ncbi:MAG TPA: RQC domain-containing protein, partial [Pirellulales bacterium]|nr:RQC domain-containing protein [Pirellulales bacterium]